LRHGANHLEQHLSGWQRGIAASVTEAKSIPSARKFSSAEIKVFSDRAKRSNFQTITTSIDRLLQSFINSSSAGRLDLVPEIPLFQINHVQLPTAAG